MAGMNAFAYMSGQTPVHKMDPRFKLGGLICLSLATVQCGVQAGIGLFLMVTLVAAISKVPVFAMIRNARVFVLFLLAIVLVRGAVTPGPVAFGGAIPWFSVNGLGDGLLISWRLFVVLLASAVFIATTRTSSVFSAVRWYFRPVPFMDGTRVAMMLSLMMRFIPIILDEANGISEAQKVRGMERRRNPLYRLTRLIPPLMERIFARAQDLSMALVARNFSARPTVRGLHATPADWLGIILLVSLCVGLRLID